MKKITIFIFVLGLFFLSPIGNKFPDGKTDEGLSITFFYRYVLNDFLTFPDEYEYLATATSLVYGKFLNYSDEDFSRTRGDIPIGSIGPGILASPMVLFGAILDKIAGNKVYKLRNTDTLRGSWTVFFFAIATVLYFWLTCYLALKIGRIFLNKSDAVIAVFCFFLAQGCIHYVFVHPILSHIYEIFLQTFLTYLFVRDYKTEFFDLTPRILVLLISLILFTMLVRYNNLNFAAAWTLAFLWKSYTYNKKIFTVPHFILAFAPICLYVLIRYYTFFINHIQNPFYILSYYGNMNIIVKSESFHFLLHRLYSVIFSLGNGLIFTAFLLIASWLTVPLFLKKKNLNGLILIFLASLFNFWILIKWGYGGPIQRYYVFSVTPILFVGFCFYVNSLKLNVKSRVLTIGISVSLVSILIQFFSERMFRYSEYDDLGMQAWGNENFIVNLFLLRAGSFELYTETLKSGFLKWVLLAIDRNTKMVRVDIYLMLQFLILYLSPMLIYSVFYRIFKFLSRHQRFREFFR